MFNWFRKRRRRKYLAIPWEESWSQSLRKYFRQYRILEHQVENGQLSPELLKKLHDATKIIVNEKSWSGIDGLLVNDEIKVTIAAQASLMLLGVNDYYFDNVSTIIVSPQSLQQEIFDGLVVHQDQHVAGLAYREGYVVLSWHDVVMGGRSSGDGHNLVIHEFAHCLDNIDGDMSGDLIFSDQQMAQRWEAVLDREYETLRDSVRTGRHTVLDGYGATNKAEFFAVAAETFFERPERLKQSHRELFQLLVNYFRINPITWELSE